MHSSFQSLSRSALLIKQVFPSAFPLLRSGMTSCPPSISLSPLPISTTWHTNSINKDTCQKLCSTAHMRTSTLVFVSVHSMRNVGILVKLWYATIQKRYIRMSNYRNHFSYIGQLLTVPILYLIVKSNNKHPDVSFLCYRNRLFPFLLRKIELLNFPQNCRTKLPLPVMWQACLLRYFSLWRYSVSVTTTHGRSSLTVLVFICIYICVLGTVVRQQTVCNTKVFELKMLRKCLSYAHRAGNRVKITRNGLTLKTLTISLGL